MSETKDNHYTLGSRNVQSSELTQDSTCSNDLEPGSEVTCDASASDETSAVVLRGRPFTRAEVEIIKTCVSAYFDQGRTFISQVVCEAINWRQPNGWLKDRACRDVLLHLERSGLIKLPPRKTCQLSGRIDRPAEKTLSRYSDLLPPFTEIPEKIVLELAKGTKTEGEWNSLVENNHYLGHTVSVGRCLKYLIKSDERLIGAIAFSSPAWQLDDRDTILHRIGITDINNAVINNTRFLMLENCRVKNAASRILSLATKQVVLDWKEYYSVIPLVAETFVQPSRFTGVCYRAANWIEVGSTKGYAKKGTSHHNSQEPKMVFLYGLNKAVRKKLAEAVKLKR